MATRGVEVSSLKVCKYRWRSCRLLCCKIVYWPEVAVREGGLAGISLGMTRMEPGIRGKVQGEVWVTRRGGPGGKAFLMGSFIRERVCQDHTVYSRKNPFILISL